MNEVVKNYYLGLDIGTNSVGWAVTDDEYNLCKFKKKDMWGIRLFENGETAAERRLQRTARRRTDRRKQRIDLLQMLFAEEMAKVDDTFFIRLNESRLHAEDKSVDFKYPLFVSDEYNDVDYHKEYPTIFHLRKELIDNPEPHDIRLVYLALHHIIKNRGHFLIDGDMKAARDFDATFLQILEEMTSDAFPFDIEVTPDGIQTAREILNSKKPNSSRAKELASVFLYATQDLDKDEKKKRKDSITHICKLFAGNKGDVAKIFYNTDFGGMEKTSFSFGEEIFSETILPEMEAVYPDEARIIESMKMLYDWGKLSEILGEEEYISKAKVKQYEKHKRDLRTLRTLILKYCDKKAYNEFFNNPNAKNAYSNYIGEVKKNGKKYAAEKLTKEKEYDAFFKNIKKILEAMSCSEDDQSAVSAILEDIENGKFLPLQRSKENASIPKQVHEAELNAILNNAESYLPFLKEKDAEGISVREKICSVFRFRIPYYVGPLSDRHKSQGANQWIKRKKEGYIYPWNFSEMVDEQASNEEFIQRMTNKCTYLVGEDVLPKNSLLYTKFMVLNELNNLRIRGNKVSVKIKQEIYNELFKTKNRVTGKSLLTCLQKDDPELRREDLTGFDGDFKAQLKSYMDFGKKVFGKRIDEEPIQNIVEDIIRWSTIYDSDSKMVRRAIEQKYGDVLTSEEIKNATKLHYTGWGNFSRKFLNGVVGVKNETGEVFTVIQALWETNDNLMQILSSDYTFMDEINTLNEKNMDEIAHISYEELVQPLYVSPSVKRAIWQTIQITEELRKVQKGAPEKIFVEMARGEDKEKKRTTSRKNQLLELYKNCEADIRSWIKEDYENWIEGIENREEREFNSIKLYLYYTQMGKDMYTGEPIDIHQLMNGNSKWDRDHIFPQSRIKDDSLDNLVLVNKTSNLGKSNTALSAEVQKKMKPFWAKLRKNGFISEKKYSRLTRSGEFTDDELSGFIARQLVETRQTTKVVADLLQKIYPNTQIVYVKARLASNFRHDDLKMLKSRRVNDYHHAKDAYLNIVVGNVYNSIFTSDPRRWFKEKGEAAKNYNIQKIFRRDVVDKSGKIVWLKPSVNEENKYIRNEDGGLTGGSIDTVRKTMLQNNVLYTEYTYCETGQLYDLTVYKKGDSSITIPIKAELPIEKYGGYKSAKTSYFAVIEYDGKKNERVRMILGVPIYVANMLEQKPGAFVEYCENVKGYKNVRVLHEKIKKNALISVNGFPMRIRGENEIVLSFKGNEQLIIPANLEKTVRKIEMYILKNSIYDVDTLRDGLDDASLNAVYDIFLCKLKGAYKKRPANQSAILEKQEQFFKHTLSLTEKCLCLDQILNMLRCDISTTADLKCIGGTAKAGNIAVNKNTISNKSKIRLINQSITGLFVNTEEL